MTSRRIVVAAFGARNTYRDLVVTEIIGRAAFRNDHWRATSNRFKYWQVETLGAIR